MTDQPIVRFADKSDLDALIECCALHAVFEKCEYISKGKKEQLEQHLFSDAPSLYCLVAELSGNIIGYTSFMKQFSTWDATSYLYMDCLFLKENARNLGIGELLINRLKEEAKALECSHIQWQTPDFNVRAMKFYDRIGAQSKSKERYFLNV
jgi:GNAT superfamily N-acetyltransferase